MEHEQTEAYYHAYIREQSYRLDHLRSSMPNDVKHIYFVKVPWPMNPVFVKPQFALTRVIIAPAAQIWPEEKHVGKFIAIGYPIAPDGTIRTSTLRTSPIVHLDIELGYIETQNSIYWIK